MERYYIVNQKQDGTLYIPSCYIPACLNRYGKNGVKFEGISSPVFGYVEYDSALPENVVSEYEFIPGPIPKYYLINENLARTAHEMMSFRDYVAGSKTWEYRRMVDEAYLIAYRQKQHSDPMYHEKIDCLVDKYARKLADNMNDSSRIGAMCPSVMICGGSNFPVRKKEKQNAASDRNMAEYYEIQNILGRIKGVGTSGISSDDPHAIEKLRNKLESLEKSQQIMKDVNAYYRKNKTLDGCPFIPEDTIDTLKEGMSKSYRIENKPFPSYSLSNNNANIRRVRERIAELEKKKSADLPKGWTFEGGKVVVNAEANRLQLVFDEKPDDDLRAELKSHGFRWAPSQGAWQRQLTNNAMYAVKRMKRLAPVS